MATEAAMNATPKEIQVGPYRYQVSFDGEAAHDYNYSGVTLYRSRRLKLDPRQSDTELPQTFLHEVLHAIGNAWEIDAWGRHTTNDK